MRLVLGVLLASAGLASCQAAADSAPDLAAIRALANRMSSSLCAGDWATYQTTWAHDSTVEHLAARSGSWITGWAKLSSLYKGMMPQVKGCRADFMTLRIHVSRDGSMAWAASDLVLHMPDSSAAPIRLWGALAFEKRDGEWKMVLDHSGVVGAQDSAGRP